MDLLRDLFINIVLLFGLVFLLSFSHVRLKHSSKQFQIIAGFVIGFITMIIMANGWEIRPGEVYDTRSVVISVTALFFSFSTGVISVLMSIIYRIYMGGIGVYAGIFTLVFAFLFGLFWKRWIHQKTKLHLHIEFYLFGFFLHLILCLTRLIFPYLINHHNIFTLFGIVMLYYPIAVVLLCYAIENHQKRIFSQELISKSERKYRSLVHNSKLGIMQYNIKGVIEIANQAFADMIGIDLARIYRFDLHNLPDVGLLEKIDQSLQGIDSVWETEYQVFFTKEVFPVRIQFTSISMNNEIVGGIAYVEDLSVEYQKNERIQLLTQRDIRTKLYNRTMFDTRILLDNRIEKYPLAMVVFDINALQVINTSFGYELGNRVLEEVANIILNEKENHAFFDAYRIEGHEFAMIVGHCDEDKAIDCIGKLKTHISEITLGDFTIGTSFGYAIINDQSYSMEQAFNDALIKLNTNKIYDDISFSKTTIDIIMATLFTKSEREKYHSDRVGVIASKIAKAFHLGKAFENRVSLSATLHDIGKINIAEEILDKPGKLDESEWVKIKKHPEFGFMILSSVPEYYDIANIVYSHHERYDGTGYPRRLKKTEIPLEARIICLADSYDAMTNQRTYRTPFTKEKAIQEIIDNQGTQFDPQVVSVFLKLTETMEF